MESSRAACATRRASTGTRSPRRCGSPTMAATGWATTLAGRRAQPHERAGQNFGFPYCHANGVADRDVARATPARRDAAGGDDRPAPATMGIHFYTGTMFPAEYRNVAFRGAQGLVEPHQEVRLRRGDGAHGRQAATRAVEPFITGFLDAQGSVLGPPGLHAADAGRLAAAVRRTDGAIYRVSYGVRPACGLAAALFLAGPLAHPAARRTGEAAAVHRLPRPQGNSQVPTTPSLAGQPRLFIENQLVLIREACARSPNEGPDGRGERRGDRGTRQLFRRPALAAPGHARRAKFQRGRRSPARRAAAPSAGLLGPPADPAARRPARGFLLEAMKQFRDHPGPGRDTIMAASLYGLKDGDLADLAHYLAHYRGGWAPAGGEAAADCRQPASARGPRRRSSMDRTSAS